GRRRQNLGPATCRRLRSLEFGPAWVWEWQASGRSSPCPRPPQCTLSPTVLEGREPWTESNRSMFVLASTGPSCPWPGLAVGCAHPATRPGDCRTIARPRRHGESLPLGG